MDWKQHFTGLGDLLSDPEYWEQFLKLLGGLGGHKSQQAYDTMNDMAGYYQSSNNDGSMTYNEFSGNNSGVSDLVPGLSENLDSMKAYLEGLMSTVGAENELNREYNSAQAAAQREFTAAENEKNRQWQIEMRNSAYQDSVADLKAAGLNPMLAATNGATSTPTGVVGAGNSASYNVGGGDTFSSILQSMSGIASAISDFLPANKAVSLIKQIGFRT